MHDLIKKMTDPIARRVKLMVGRAVLAALTDNGGRQYVQFSALKGEVKDKVERVQQYGFSSNPPAGSQVIFVCVGGNRDHPIAISVDDPASRPQGEDGESWQYTYGGNSFVLKPNGEAVLTCTQLTVNASEKARFVTPTLEVTGEIKDNCDADGVSMSAMRTTYDSHTHPGDSGGTTGGPNQPMGGGA